jgi:hypothetical protein
MDPHPLAMQPRGQVKDLHHEAGIKNGRIFQCLDFIQPGDLILQLCYELTDLLAHAGRLRGGQAADRYLEVR